MHSNITQNFALYSVSSPQLDGYSKDKLWFVSPGWGRSLQHRSSQPSSHRYSKSGNVPVVLRNTIKLYTNISTGFLHFKAAHSLHRTEFSFLPVSKRKSEGNLSPYCHRNPKDCINSFFTTRHGRDGHAPASVHVSEINEEPPNEAGIATCYGLDGAGIEFRWKPDFPQPSRPWMWSTQPSI